ncbi:MAG: TadE/TadG family type IV pilus assembly protein [Chakrabartia sp.]
MTIIDMKTRRLRKDKRGIAAVEFALIAPTFLVLLMGGLEAGHSLYMKAILEGAVQKAARDASLETGTIATQRAVIDAAVTAQVKAIYNGVNPTISRRFYRSFEKAAAAQMEPFSDTPATAGIPGQPNGLCDRGESYTDNNNNNGWDKDGADAGQGSAEDKVLYTVTMSYPRLFGIGGLLGLPPQQTLKATTIIGNQPYGEQQQYTAPTARNCPL